MPLMFGATKRPRDEESRQDPRLLQAKDTYQAGRVKIVTTDEVPGRDVLGVYGVVACRGYVFENAFYGLIAQALDANADAIVGYRESLAFHPEGDKYYSCYGTAVRLKPIK